MAPRLLGTAGPRRGHTAILKPMTPRLFLAAAFAITALAGDLLAQQHAREEPAAPVESPRSELPESVLRAERETGGQVLRAESMQRDGREIYRLKVLTPDGRVRIMRDDPRERRRDAWRESRATPPPNAFERRNEDAEESRREPAPSANELGLPETLPPPERGDHY